MSMQNFSRLCLILIFFSCCDSRGYGERHYYGNHRHESGRYGERPYHKSGERHHHGINLQHKSGGYGERPYHKSGERHYHENYLQPESGGYGERPYHKSGERHYHENDMYHKRPRYTSNAVSLYPMCKTDMILLEVVVLTEIGRPVKYAKIMYNDFMETKVAWTGRNGLAKFYVDGCEIGLIIYSKKTEVKYHQVDLTSCYVHRYRTVVLVKPVSNFLIDFKESDKGDGSFGRISYMYTSDANTGRGQVVAGGGKVVAGKQATGDQMTGEQATAIPITVQDKGGLEVYIVSQTATVMSYLHMSKVDTDHMDDVHMRLPPYFKDVTSNKFAFIFGINIWFNRNGVGESDIILYITEANIFISDGTKITKELPVVKNGGHFLLKKEKWEVEKDYLVIVRLSEDKDGTSKATKKKRLSGNGYFVDCHGNLESVEITKDQFWKPGKWWIVGCFCKGNFDNFVKVNQYTNEPEQYEPAATNAINKFNNVCTECVTT